MSAVRVVYVVTTPRLCARVEVERQHGAGHDDAVIVDAAPILRWTLHRPLRELTRWAELHDGNVVAVMAVEKDRR